jgi:hypothetical protein
MSGVIPNNKDPKIDKQNKGNEISKEVYSYIID